MEEGYQNDDKNRSHIIYNGKPNTTWGRNIGHMSIKEMCYRQRWTFGEETFVYHKGLKCR